MRAVIQRVAYSKVEVDGKIVGDIEQGLMVLLGVTHEDGEADMDRLIKKILNLRIFNDAEGKMNLSVQDINGQIQVISQFTLYADTRKGNRPSFMRSAKPDVSLPMYQQFLEKLRWQFSGKVAEGKFGAEMKVSLLNDGPVTIILDTKQIDF
ncbi:MAG: D-aminoacyl-tRNA deacylase [Bacteroidota bacterium]